MNCTDRDIKSHYHSFNGKNIVKFKVFLEFPFSFGLIGSKVDKQKKIIGKCAFV